MHIDFFKKRNIVKVIYSFRGKRYYKVDWDECGIGDGLSDREPGLSEVKCLIIYTKLASQQLLPTLSQSYSLKYYRSKFFFLVRLNHFNIYIKTNNEFFVLYGAAPIKL
jgi:hypothetical protein